MQVIELSTQIHAPIARCFDLALSIDLEAEVGRPYGLRAIAGRTSGIIGAGEQVTWKAIQFGFSVTHTSVISKYQKPNFFEDSMVEGAFRSFHHLHTFHISPDGGTSMLDSLRFAMPFRPLGYVLEVVLVRKRMLSLLHARNARIKHVAESQK